METHEIVLKCTRILLNSLKNVLVKTHVWFETLTKLGKILHQNLHKNVH